MKALQYLLSKNIYILRVLLLAIFSQRFFFLFFDVLSAFQSLMILFSEPIIHLCTLCEVVY